MDQMMDSMWQKVVVEQMPVLTHFDAYLNNSWTIVFVTDNQDTPVVDADNCDEFEITFGQSLSRSPVAFDDDAKFAVCKLNGSNKLSPLFAFVELSKKQ